MSTYFGKYGNEIYLAGDGAHRDAEGDYWLMGRIDDLHKFLDECDQRAREWESHDARLARLLDVEGEGGGAPLR